MSQKEETIQKLSQIRTSLTSEENDGGLREKIDLDKEVQSYNKIGEIVGRQLGVILGGQVGERLGRAFDERFGGGATLSSITDVVSNALETSRESETESSDEAASNDSSESSSTDSDDDSFEAVLSEMSTENLQSLANQLMDELQQRSETE